MLQYEKNIWNRGHLCIGIDEVGRGAFAGPMAVGGVIFDNSIEKRFKNSPTNLVIRDSKKMTPLQRTRAYEWISQNCVDYYVTFVKPKVIDRHGLTSATQQGFLQVVNNLTSKHKINYLLIDAFELKNHKEFPSRNQQAIKGGDSISLSIAAAAIMAKVERDNLMCELAQKHPHYLWDKNKGYGTKAHRNALEKFGTTELHRKTFIHKISFY